MDSLVQGVVFPPSLFWEESKSPSTPVRFDADFCAGWCRTDPFLRLGGLIRWLLVAAGDRQAAAVDATGLRGAEFPRNFGGATELPCPSPL